MQRSRTLRWVAAVLVPVTILLSGCDPFDEGEGDGGKPTVPTKQASIGKQAGCGQPGQKVKQWLPAFDRSNAREATIGSLQNPCPPFADLAGLINDAIADKQVGNKEIGRFREGVHRLAGKFLTAAEVAKCGYETDRLALGLYQHRDAPWSIGVVVVVRGTFGAVTDVLACYLGGQLLPPGVVFRDDGNRPAPRFCPMSGVAHSNGEDYALLALGSSSWMCTALRRTMPKLSLIEL